MAHLSQLAAYELDGFFESPHDAPPKWLLMLTMHVDESIDQESGMCIVGGYLGKRKHWKAYVDAWSEARSPFPSVHLKEMRLGSSIGKRRYEKLLAKLGPVPAACGLIPIVGSICLKDYITRVKGSVSEDILAPYIMALIAMLDGVAVKLPKGERVEIIFEQQDTYAIQRDRAVTHWNNLMQTKRGDKHAIVAKWGYVSKSIMTEASDYLCYAMIQRDIDRTSQKAKLTSSILKAKRYRRHHTSAATVDFWLDNLELEGRKPLRPSTPELRKVIRKTVC